MRKQGKQTISKYAADYAELHHRAADIELETDKGVVTFSELYGGEEWRKTS